MQFIYMLSPSHYPKQKGEIIIYDGSLIAFENGSQLGRLKLYDELISIPVPKEKLLR